MVRGYIHVHYAALIVYDAMRVRVRVCAQGCMSMVAIGVYTRLHSECNSVPCMYYKNVRTS